MLPESLHNYYKILGCDRNASPDAVKRAYHELVLRYHPDKSTNSEEGVSRFQQIDEAWKVLRDPESRREYDAECKQAELEAEGVLIYARIKRDELEATSDADEMNFPCRCGSTYILHSEDLLERNTELHVPCQECTFAIIVET